MTLLELNKGTNYLIKQSGVPTELYPEEAQQYNNAANDFLDEHKRSRALLLLGSLGLGYSLSGLAHGGAVAKDKSDSIDQNQTTQWAKKYLNSNAVDVKPEKDLGNAYYTTATNQYGDLKHIIRYDPKFNKSTAAHEIGHGMSSFPRVPFSNLLAPGLMMSGGFDYGTSLGLGDGTNDGLGRLLGGAAMSVPTLIDEYGASANAKTILKDNNIKPRGLTRAWATYAAPTAVGLGGAGLGYYNAKKHTDNLHELNPDWDIRFKE